MKLRLLSNVLLLSTMSLSASAGDPLSLGKKDFRTAQTITRHEEALVSAKLSKSGREKFKVFNHGSVGHEIQIEIAGIASHFKLRDPIKGDSLEMGPYTRDEAAKIVSEINR